VLLAGATGCKRKLPPVLFADDFERQALGEGWLDTGGKYRIEGGKVNVEGAHNHPLWLRTPLPRDAMVEIDVMSTSPDGDLKIELFGDGKSFDPDMGGYVSSGYVFIFGGWRNQLSVIARHNEHNEGVKAQRSDIKVEPGRTYRWTIVRKGGRIDWLIDGDTFLSWTDPQPLEGPGHQHLALNNWEASIYFDNLRIRPAP
jgi:hypothetical protein